MMGKGWSCKEGDLCELADLLLDTVAAVASWLQRERQNLGQDSLDGGGPAFLLSDSNKLKEWKVLEWK